MINIEIKKRNTLIPTPLREVLSAFSFKAVIYDPTSRSAELEEAKELTQQGVPWTLLGQHSANDPKCPLPLFPFSRAPPPQIHLLSSLIYVMGMDNPTETRSRY